MRRSHAPTARPRCASPKAASRRFRRCAAKAASTSCATRAGSDDAVLLVAYGAMVPIALDVADRVADQGIEVRVVDPRYVVPVPAELMELARRARLVVTLEDNGVQGGAGSTLAGALRAANVDTPLRDIGLPQRIPASGHPGRRCSAGSGCPRRPSPVR